MKFETEKLSFPTKTRNKYNCLHLARLPKKPYIYLHIFTKMEYLPDYTREEYVDHSVPTTLPTIFSNNRLLSSLSL